MYSNRQYGGEYFYGDTGAFGEDGYDVGEDGSFSGDAGVHDHGGLLIYIDNSNIWINTMEMSAKSLKFRSDIKQDQRTRVNINNLLRTASNGRPIIRAVLYGSEPPPVGKFWNNVKECKFCSVDVQVTRRSTYSNKEREVDQSIMLDIGEDVVIHQNHAKYGGTVILFTGDGGMISAVRRALKYNWNVEVWAYKGSMAKDYIEEEGKSDKFQLRFMDDYFTEIVFYTLEWKNTIPHERSFVISFKRLPQEKRAEVLEILVKAVTELVRMPMAGRYLKVKDSRVKDVTHLAIVCSVGKLILKEDARSDAHLKLMTDVEQHNHNNGRTSSPHSGRRNGFSFTYGQWDKVPELLAAGNLRDDPRYYDEMKIAVENLVQEALVKSNSSFIDNPKYDFNADIYHAVENFLNFEKPIHDFSAGLQESMDFILHNYSPVLRSVPQFLQNIQSELYPDNELRIVSPAIEDDGEGGFTVVSGKKLRKTFQKYSELCKYSYRCTNGFKCTYNHSDQEQEFFKIQPDAKLRLSYKYKACDHYKIQNCKYKGPLSYMCPFSHGYFCLSCKCDTEGGHDEMRCPGPRVPRPSESDFEYVME